MGVKELINVGSFQSDNITPTLGACGLTLSLPRVINIEFPSAASPEITPHTMENPAFHSFTQMQDYYTFNSHYLTYTIAL